MTQQKLKSTSCKVYPETWKKIKIRAVVEEREVQEVVEDALKLYLKEGS